MATKGKSVETLTHDEATRKNIPTAEHESVLGREHQEVKELRYPRNTDLDPQLVWRGKDEQDWSDLVVPSPPLYIQEKVHPKVLIDDLMRANEKDEEDAGGEGQVDLFSDFNGIPEGVERTDYYEHDQNWSNRMILGDSLQVMASLAEREGLRGQVQCIYLDPPYGIKFNSNFQWSTTSRDVKDGKADHITRQPEQVKAFRDTWRDGVHSYLTYLRDRLTVARDLLTESGSIFVQIGDENVHRVRALMDEVFGEENFCGLVGYKKTTGAGSPAIGTEVIASVKDYLIWYARSKPKVKYRQLYLAKEAGEDGAKSYNRVQSPDGRDVQGLRADEDFGRDYADKGWHLVTSGDLTSQTGVDSTRFPVDFEGRRFRPSKGGWKTNASGMQRLHKASRLTRGGIALRYVRRLTDFAVYPLNNDWSDTGTGSFTDAKIYVVQSGVKAVQRCLLMTTDPGDLVLDPTCGSGTTAYVAEEWGRRWITIDTSRVALALSRARVMGARYPFYLLADSPAGQRREAEITRTAPSTKPTNRDIRQGFVYERVPHITLKSIANNAEIDVIWDHFQEEMDPVLQAINAKRGLELQGWQIPREAGDPWPGKARQQHDRYVRVTTAATRQQAVDRVNEIMGRDYTIETFPEHPVDPWTDPELLELHEKWWELRIGRQKEIDASIAARADFEYLYDQPCEDPKTVRVAGPFTVESLSPHRTLGVNENDELIDPMEVRERPDDYAHLPEFGQMVLENLRIAGVQQAHKEDRIEFTSLHGWPGSFICAEGRYQEGAAEKRAGIFIGPEFGTVRRSDLVDAAREAGDADFDVLIACAFNYEPHASEFDKLGRVPVLKARMNADLHMADDLKNTGSGNLFVIFGEPDIDLLDTGEEVRVKINGVDVFDPSTGEVRSDDADGIACWFVDTDYNGESFFVRQAYFLGANDPYKSLKTTLRAEIDEDAWESLHSDTSRPFPRPSTGRVAVKVINHLGDEVMKVFRV
jgi:adenine-specific DNA-methyltransferase